MLTVFGPILETVLPKAMTITKAPTFAGAFVMVTHIRGTWKTVIEDLTRLSELLDDGEADNV